MLSGAPAGEAIAWELASLLVDVLEHEGLDAIDQAMALNLTGAEL